MRPVCLPEKYEIIGTLGSGGMGTVWHARDRILQRDVALKVLAEKFADDPQFVQRFMTEARAAASLNHPNIVQIYEFGTTDRGHFLAMELIDGSSLKTELKQRGRFSEAETIALARQACAALAVAHAAGIVHRDIKPDNMMFTRSRQFKLVDLGLAKKLADETSQTMTGQSLGTPHFISPEQILGAGGIDARADIYSLGATMYYLATGAVPFDGTSGAHIMSRHLNDPLPDPRHRAPDLSPDFCRILGRMMAKDPGDRYQDITAVDSDLQTLQRGDRISGVTPVATAVQDTIFISSPDLSQGPPPVTWDEDELTRLTSALARYVGPLARVLVGKARKSCCNWAELVEELSGHISDPADQAAFCAKGERVSRGEQTTQVSVAGAADPGATMALPGVGADKPPAGLVLNENTMTTLAQALADQIGPVARVVVRREAARATDLADLSERLLANIEGGTAKAAFRQAIRDLG